MMADADIVDHWNKSDKMNWVKGIWVLEITEDSIRPFVEKEITKFHLDIKSEFKHSSLCGRCRSDNASECPSRICNDITSHIESVHRYGPCYTNSDITQWLYNPWEIAKCYMNPNHNLTVKSLCDIDLLCLLSVVINNTRFQSLISAVNMTNKENIFWQGQKGRNEIMHARRFQLTAKALNRYCDTFIDIVNHIGTDKAECVRKIEKVRDTPLSITEKDIGNVKEQAASYKGSAKVPIEELKKKEREETLKVGDLNYRTERLETKAADVDEPVREPDICDEIKKLCISLEEEHGNNVTVVACRNQDAFDLTVISNDLEIDKTFIVQQCKEYEQHLRIDIRIDLRKVTDEGYRVMHSDVFTECIESESFFQDMNKINAIISRNSKRIYTDAKHVNSVFFSPVRSVGHMANDHKMLKEPCIVVYVDVKFDKGRIPIECITIPQWIEGIRTDVREGMTKFLCNPVSVGCKVSPHDIQQTGSMGPFIDMGDDKVGFLTSLHVLLPRHLYSLYFAGALDIDDIPNTTVYQPKHDIYPSRILGHINCLICSEGSVNVDSKIFGPGFEVAVVELQNCIPTDGGFPSVESAQNEYTEENQMEYTCGETVQITEKNCREIMKKYGACTGHTTGTCRYTCTRHSSKIKMGGDKSYIVDLAFQFAFRSTKYNADKPSLNPFAKPGDSGSLVLMKESGKLKAVGIVTGESSDGSICVTPIEPICDELRSKKRRWSLKKFQNEYNNNGIEEQMDCT